MARLRLRHSDIPPALAGWLLVDDQGVPRYWATVWINVLKAHLSEGTRSLHLKSVEQLYRTAATQAGDGSLDAILSSCDFDGLRAALGAHLVRLRNESARSGVSRDIAWHTALSFVQDVVRHVGAASQQRMSDVTAGLLQLERLYSQLSPSGAKPAPPIRALPAVVIDDLYRLFDPNSADNPFRTPALRWRNFLIFLMLLHLGLRRGEILILPADAVKDDIDPATGEVRPWINIVETPYEDEDPRFEAPSLKTEHSRRQLPISHELVRVADLVTAQYRFGARHSYLFASQRGKPLAVRSVHHVFAKVSSCLSPPALKALVDRGLSSVSAHDLRHTCAVYRLARYQALGNGLDTAIEKLRVFFGWAPNSDMPRHYARAYFETTLSEVWNDGYDTFVTTLRGMEGRR
jgi:integrase